MSENNSDFLAEIYRCARMGTETISTLVPKVKNTEMRNELLREESEFRELEEKSLKEMNKEGQTPHPINKMQEVMSYMGIQMNTVTDSSPSHIASMMIKGNNMGIIGLTTSKNEHKDASPAVCSLAGELTDLLQNNIEKLKAYL